MPSDELTEIADRLYAEPQTAFTAARDLAAKAVADKALAARVKALKKPSVAAWAVNLLVRREADQIDQVLALAESLRAAAESLDGDELRTLTRQRRQLTAALTTTAGHLAREHGVRLTTAVSDQVEAVLTAAMLDPVAASVVRSGLVITAFTSTGVSEVDVPAVCAVPEAVGHRATQLEAPVAGPPVLHVVPDDTLRIVEARAKVEAAVLELAEAAEERDHRAATSARLTARRLQLQGEIDELRRRLAGIEDEVDALDDEIEEAAEEEGDADAAHGAAEEALAAARAELERLTS